MKLVFPRTATLLAATLLFAGLTASAQAVSPELQKVRETISERFVEIEPEHVTESPIPGWFMIRKGAIVAYVSSDGRYLLQGDVIDLVENENLSEQSRNEARVAMMSSISEDDAIVFSPQHVEHSIYVFTDIDCTFCRRLHSQIDEYLAEGIEVRYIFYPRSGPKTKSWTKAEEVWCADDRNEALTLAKLDKTFPTKSCDASIVGTHYSMGQDVGLTGTPAIVLSNGILFSGYMPAPRLKEAIVASSE